MSRCIKCGQRPVTFIRYNGTHLCQQHFIEYVEKRVKREIRDQISFDGRLTVSVALSGGKDSAVALTLLSEILGERRDTEVKAITIDEGIAGYRPASVKEAEALTERLGVELQVVSFSEEFCMEMDDIVHLIEEKTPCTYCGVLRRKCLNMTARENGSDLLATGLNLDDTTQSVLMNFARGDVERMARMGPHTEVQPGLVPRIQPLRKIPEKESYLFAILRQIPFSDSTCPYADPALRNDYREIIDGLEDRSPGTRYSILASHDAIQPLLKKEYEAASLAICECGEPALDDRCKACRLLRQLEERKDQRKS